MAEDFSLKVDDRFTVKFGHLSSSEVWEAKDVWAEAEKRSIKEWETLSDEQREVLVTLVQTGLDRLIDRAPEWVPASLDIQRGQYIDINCRIIMTDYDMEVSTRTEITQRQIREAAEATAAIVREATADGNGRSDS